MQKTLLITKLVFIPLMLIVALSSCVKYKGLVLMEENEKVLESLRSPSVVNEAKFYPFKPYLIRPYDQLMIRINAFDGSTEEFLNREFAEIQGYSRNLNYEPSSLYFNTYSVDGNGYLKLPIIQKVKVDSMTVGELKTQLDSLYMPYLNFAATDVKMGNMRVTVLGEVNDPGLHYLYNEKNTILDVLSLAGNTTDFADLKKVKLIRQTGTGSITVFLDLGSPDFIYTEYFYVRPYDIIYLEPIRAKAFDSSSQSVGIVLSTISILVLLVNIFVK